MRYALDFPPDWSAVELIRSSVSLCIQAVLRDAEVSAQVSMVSAELLENALKHGDATRHPIRYTLDATDGEVSVRVENAYSDAHCADELCSRLEAIAQAESPYAAYVAQLAAVVAGGPESEGQLGLFRIAYEGGFDLRCGVDAAANVLYVEGRLRREE